MQNVRFLYNPSSGETIIAEWLDTIISIYQQADLSLVPYRLVFDAGEEDRLFDGVDETFRHVLVAGGDGTVNYVVNAMKHRGIDLPVAVLPTGTANDFAGTLGIPVNPAEACRAILNGIEQRIDLGRVNDTYFVNVFSCGLLTDISQKTPTVLKNTFGKLAYYFSGLAELPSFRKMQIEIESDGGNYKGTSLVFFVFNGRTAGQLRLAYLSEIDDGLLDVLIVRGNSPISTLRTLFHFLGQNTGFRNTAKKGYPRGIIHLKACDIRISCTRNEATDIDGQPGPGFPIHITCEPGALRCLRPAAKPTKKK